MVWLTATVGARSFLPWTRQHLTELQRIQARIAGQVKGRSVDKWKTALQSSEIEEHLREAVLNLNLVATARSPTLQASYESESHEVVLGWKAELLLSVGVLIGLVKRA